MDTIACARSMLETALAVATHTLKVPIFAAPLGEVQKLSVTARQHLAWLVHDWNRYSADMRSTYLADANEVLCAFEEIAGELKCEYERQTLDAQITAEQGIRFRAEADYWKARALSWAPFPAWRGLSVGQVLMRFLPDRVAYALVRRSIHRTTSTASQK